MSVPAESSRFTLRDLPLPAKVVITCFLLSVGLGYTAAMVQLHFQDSKSGQPMPTPADVVLKFTGKKWFTEPPPPPVSKFVKLITTSSGNFTGNGTMLPAFFEKDHSFRKALGTGADETKLRGEREGERDALVAWAQSPADERKKAFESDHFGLAPDEMPKSITERFKIGSAVKVKSIIEARCVSCHGKGSPQESMALETYAQIEKYLAVPEVAPFKAGGDWVRVEEPIGLEKLTQSTHAHLLSFAVLFSLTGLVFAFTSYPTFIRCIISPLVLLAIVTDVAFWWLARLSEGYGVFFAHGIIGTGGIAGLGLGAQITMSLWNMYGPKGKAVIVALFATGAVLFGLVFTSVIVPGLEAKKAQRDQTEKSPEKKEEPKKEEAKKDDKKDIKIDTPPGPSAMERVLTFPFKGADGKEIPLLEIPFKKEPAKNMVRAFFDQDGADFKMFKGAAKEKAIEERHGELSALRTWIKLPDAERKKTYDADAFPLPSDLGKKPFTEDYIKDGRVKIKTIIEDRCVRCHADEEKAIFKDYETLKKFLEPEAPRK